MVIGASSQSLRALVKGMPALCGLAAAALSLLALSCGLSDRGFETSAVREDRPPAISPDYSGCVIPPNIAPLSFRIAEPGVRYHARIHGGQGTAIDLSSKSGSMIIPVDPWRGLLAANRGGELWFDVWVKNPDGQWQQFDRITNTVAAEEIDRYLAYRLIRPLYTKWTTMGIYQRDLESYEESLVIHNKDFDGGCVNCHTFLQNSPDSMIAQIRSAQHGVYMLLAQDGEVTRVDTRTPFNASPAAYSSWHPNGRLIAFSVNKLCQFFHDTGVEVREVFDDASDLAVYAIDENTVTTTAGISMPGRQETFPAWSADGRHLYFSSAPATPIDRFLEAKYDLLRISYDPETGTWGEPETLVSAEATDMSATEAKASPDGRYLMFSMADHGNFPIYQPSCDLYLMDLETLDFRRLEVNSDRCDSWHSWSSNSRWFVFSSKRDDGLFTRLYISYLDEEGRAHKPFLLPQKDPAFYDGYLRVYNVPELYREAVRATPRALATAVYSPRSELAASLDPNVPLDRPPHEPGPGPWSQAWSDGNLSSGAEQSAPSAAWSHQ